MTQKWFQLVKLLFVTSIAGAIGCGRSDRNEQIEQVGQGELPVNAQDDIQVQKAQERTCPRNVAEMLAQAYLLSMPFKDGELNLTIGASSEISRYVQSNREMFAENGPVSNCAVALGGKIVSMGAEAYQHSEDTRSRIISNWGGQAPEVASRAANDVQSAGGSMFAMGTEMQWLAQVLPDVARGNYDAYNAAGSMNRKQLKEIAPFMGMLQQMNKEIGGVDVQKIISQSQKQYSQTLKLYIVTLAETLP